MSHITASLAFGILLLGMEAGPLYAQEAAAQQTPPPVILDPSKARPTKPIPRVPPAPVSTPAPLPAPAQNPLTTPAPLPGPAIPSVQPPFALPASDTNTPGGKIQFAMPIYDFGRVKSGDTVKHTFVFTNVGCQTLELSHVQPQCGCTAAGEWTRKVEPGETGNIPIQFNTANFNGPVFKTISVACNDKTQPVVMLQLKGTVWKPIEFVPPYTILTILPDMTNTTATVKIVNNMEEPVQVWAPECPTPGFSARLTTNLPGKEYQVTLSATPPLNPGTMQGKITVRTSATNVPTLDVPFWANVQAPVMVLPPQIMLPAAPLANRVMPAVTVQNNTTNILTLTDPVVNVPGVDVQVRELQPGRIFNLQLTFPEGLEVQPGQKAVLTFKTSHPRFKQVEVPIVQMAKPLVPAANPVQGLPLRTKVIPTTQIQPAGKIAAPQPSPKNPSS